MSRTVIRSLLSSLVALCLLLGPPRTGALSSARLGEDQGERSSSESKDGAKDSDDPKDGKDARDGQGGKDGKESEVATALSSAFSLPRRLPGGGQRSSGTVSPLPPEAATLRDAATPSPAPPLPAKRLPRRLT